MWTRSGNLFCKKISPSNLMSLKPLSNSTIAGTKSKNFSTTPFRCQQEGNRKSSNFFNADLRTILISLSMIGIGVGSYYSYKRKDRILEYKEKRREERKEAIQEYKEVLSEKIDNAKEGAATRKEKVNEKLDKAKNWINSKRNKKDSNINNTDTTNSTVETTNNNNLEKTK